MQVPFATAVPWFQLANLPMVHAVPQLWLMPAAPFPAMHMPYGSMALASAWAYNQQPQAAAPVATQPAGTSAAAAVYNAGDGIEFACGQQDAVHPLSPKRPREESSPCEATDGSGTGLAAPRVVLGDCVAGMRALPSASVDLLIADPPYNIGVQGSPWDKLPEYMAWSRAWMTEAARLLRPGGALFIYGSPVKLWIDRLKLLAADELGLEFVQHISWVYKQGGDSRLTGMTCYSVRMEHLEWFVKPGGKHTFNPQEAVEHYTPAEFDEALAKGVGRVTAESLSRGRPPNNWWDIPRENSRSKERKFGAHPSMKPLKLCERIMAVHSNWGDRVLIPFGGSGSEVAAAARLGRQVLAFELEPQYHRIILRRLVGHGHLLPTELPPPSPSKEPEAPAAAQPDPDAAGGDGEMPVEPPLITDARNTSGYRGVYKHGQRWVAKAMLNGALQSLGRFDSPRQAAVAYALHCAASHDENSAPKGSLIKQQAKQQKRGPKEKLNPPCAGAAAALAAPELAVVGPTSSAASSPPLAPLDRASVATADNAFTGSSGDQMTLV
jgi:site-specific DNA-methyltransferase (adenine-specific)